MALRVEVPKASLRVGRIKVRGGGAMHLAEESRANGSRNWVASDEVRGKVRQCTDAHRSTAENALNEARRDE